MLRVTKIANEFFIIRDIDNQLGDKSARCFDCPHVIGDLYDRDCAYPDCIKKDNEDLNKARQVLISELIQLTKAGEPVILINEPADLVNFGIDPDKIINLTKD